MSLFKKLFGKAKEENAPVSGFATYKSKIYPWVKVSSEDTTGKPAAHVITLSGEDQPVCEPWLGGLIITYVEDSGNSFRMILNRDLPEGFTKAQLHELALANIKRDIGFEVRQTHFGGFGLIADGNHEAASICLPELWKAFAGQLSDDIVVAVPAKDLVLYVPGSDGEAIIKLQEAVEEVFQSYDRLLTKRLFRFNKESNNWSKL